MKSSRVTLRSPAEIAQAREAGHLAVRVLHMITPHVQPGVNVEDTRHRTCRHLT